MLGRDVVCVTINVFFFICISFHVVNLLLWPGSGIGNLYRHLQVMKVVFHLVSLV